MHEGSGKTGAFLPSGQVPDGTRFLLSGDTLMWREYDGGPVYECWLDTLTNPVVWIDNETADDIYMKGDPQALESPAARGLYGLDTILTIGCHGDIYGYGPPLYHTASLHPDSNRAMLGLISVYGDFQIADDPDLGPDWDPPWDIVTDG
ncbi:hypothetical protein GF402_02000, partial [Candidatus Fermentibacteria bacterium]|nr:hypothetical protein [Candidatus Fermentibacteria bacterium]